MRPVFLLLLPALLACTSSTSQAPPAFSETFEAGTKPGYAAAPEALTTGSWLFTEALIGSSDQDHKTGQHAARLRAGGKLTMQFDVPAGHYKIDLLAAAYGHDAPSTWELWQSTDHGRTWQRNGPPQGTNGAPFVVAAFAAPDNKPFRLEIRKTDAGKGRLNIDDIDLEPVSAAYPRTTPATSPAATGYFKDRNSSPSAPAAQTPKTTTQQPDNDNLLLGNPSGATSDPANTTNYLLIHPQYATGYNAQRGIPVWTSWHVGRLDLTKAAPRQDDFRPDPALPRQFYQVAPQSYSGSGFDKGHNCPSGDRTASLDDNSATFLMSNMVPQAPLNNQQTWAHLEEYTRAQVMRGQEAYVLMGSYGRGGTGKNGPATTLDQGRVSVPARLWKVIVFLPEGSNDLQRIAAGQGRIVAIDTPNDNSIQPRWEQYLTSVDKIEAASGLDIFSALPLTTQAQLQSQVDPGRAR